jgi:hypothetical protein
VLLTNAVCQTDSLRSMVNESRRMRIMDTLVKIYKNRMSVSKIWADNLLSLHVEKVTVPGNFQLYLCFIYFLRSIDNERKYLASSNIEYTAISAYTLLTTRIRT